MSLRGGPARIQEERRHCEKGRCKFKKSEVIARRAGANSRRAMSLRGAPVRIQEERRHCEEGRCEFKKSDVIARSAATKQPLDELVRSLGDCRVGLRPPRNDFGDDCHQSHFPSAFRDRQQSLHNQLLKTPAIKCVRNGRQ